ncbi:hypothetical protein IWX49DRAFT_216211 [Phyllosticta citricarpa]
MTYRKEQTALPPTSQPSPVSPTRRADKVRYVQRSTTMLQAGVFPTDSDLLRETGASHRICTQYPESAKHLTQVDRRLTANDQTSNERLRVWRRSWRGFIVPSTAILPVTQGPETGCPVRASGRLLVCLLTGVRIPTCLCHLPLVDVHHLQRQSSIALLSDQQATTNRRAPLTTRISRRRLIRRWHCSHPSSKQVHLLLARTPARTP